MTQKVWTKEAIIAKLDESPIMVERSLVRLYFRQTADERSVNGTRYSNGVGFTGADANLMSKFAQWVLKGKEKGYAEGKLLSEKQLVLTRKRIKKYAGQLVNIAETGS